MSEKKQLTEQELLKVAGGLAESEKKKIQTKCKGYNHKGSAKPECQTDPDCKISRTTLTCVSKYQEFV